MSKPPEPHKLLSTHTFVFNPKDHDGESLVLKTEFLDNGDKENSIYTNHVLTLNSYFNSASIELLGVEITPSSLRQLADELDGRLDAIYEDEWEPNANEDPD